jgi:hypothetical protein
MARTTRSRVGSTPAAVLAIAVGLGTLTGCNDDTAGPETGISIADIQDGTSDLTGTTVTVSAVLNEVLADFAFTMADPVDTDVDPLLVIHSPDATDAEDPTVDLEDVDVEGTGIQVTGVVRQDFDLLAAEDEFGVDYPDEAFAVFDGEPYLVATTVDPSIY